LPRRPKELGVWLGREQIAVLEERRRYEISCRYTDVAREHWAANGPVLSCSLLMSDRRRDAIPFCRGLLPEGDALEAAALQAKVSVIDVFALLRHFGRDIAGAFVISEGDPETRRPEALPYAPEQLDEEVRELPDRPLGLHEDSELSLAGLQNKILLVRLPTGEWARPVHGYPSTHILKADDARHPGLVDAEAACLYLAGAVGLTSITSELADIGGTRCLIVSRFDRHESKNGELPVRVHQEDTCQALGIDSMSERGRAKYERHGGPSFKQIATILNAYATTPQDELDKLTKIMAFNVLIGNADAHGKNLALLHEPLGTVSLAPLYDTVPTMLWPKLRQHSAMSTNHRTDLQYINVEDLAAEAASWGYSKERAREQATTIIEEVAAAAANADLHDATAALVHRRRDLLLAKSP
jgi:serine/threonine-protein kinase HipA